MEVRKGYKKTEIGLFPNDWDTPSLGALFAFKNGLNKAKKYFGYGTPIVNYMDVYKKRGLVTADLQGRVSLNKQELKTFNVQKGDVFFTRTSETAAEVGIASVMLEEPKDTVFSGFILRARPKNNSLKDHYKRYCFSPSFVRNQITSSSTETTRALTTGRYLSTVVIACPKPDEQTIIATAISDTEELISSLEKLIAKKLAMKQGAMQELLTGKKRLPGFSGAWKEVEIKDLCQIEAGEITEGGNDNYLEIGDINIESKAYCISEKEKLSVPGSVKVPRGTLLISTVRPTRGAITITKEKTYVSSAFCRLKIVNKLVFYIVNHDKFLKYLGDNSTGGTYPTCRKEDILSYKCLVPKLPEEQTAIASILSDMDTEIESLEKKLSKYRLIKQGMMQELLTGKTRLV